MTYCGDSLILLSCHPELTCPELGSGFQDLKNAKDIENPGQQ
jgi:hypothetical protein